MKVPFNDLNEQFKSIGTEVMSAISSVIDRSAFIDGEEVSRFELEFGAYCGGSCAAVSNGTDAVMLALLALGIGHGDEVIVTANSFIATVEPIFHLGAIPVFVDIGADSYNIDVASVRSAITSKTKAILAVHLYGLPADMVVLAQIAEANDIWLIEDCAQAHGASISGTRVGALGDIAAFSFYPGKNLGAFGDAGAVVSKDSSLIEEVRRLRNHGRDRGQKYSHSRIGYNCRMDTLQAAILSVKLKYLEAWIERRREIAHEYSKAFARWTQVPAEPEGYRHVYHLYVLALANREQFMAELNQAGIQTGIHYPVPLHLHAPIRDKLGHRGGDFPRAERAANCVVSLPIFPEMTEDMVQKVIVSVSEYWASREKSEQWTGKIREF